MTETDSSRRRWLVPVVAVALTALAAGTMLWALETRQASGPVVPVAIVNQDNPVKTGSGKDQKTVAAGRQLAAGLTQPDPKDQTPLAWQIVDESDAAKGLVDGTYYAVLTIPKEFSADVTSTSGKDPKQAGLKLVANDASSLAVATMAQLAVRQAAINLGDQVTDNFTDSTMKNFTTIHTNLTSSAQSAEKLDTSSQQLASSAKKLDSSSASLAEGAANLSTGATSLANGAQKLESGADSAEAGAASLSSGSRKLAVGADKLAAGARKADRGADAVALGARAVSRDARVVDRLATAGSRVASRVATATDRTARGADVVANSAARIAADCLARTGDRAFCDRLDLLARAASVEARAAEVVSRAASGSARLSAGVDTRVGRLAAGNERLAGAAARVAVGTGGVRRGASTLDRSAADLASGAAKLAKGTASVAAGAEQTADGTTQLAQSAKQLASGSAQLASGNDQLASGAKQLASGNDQLASGLTSGAKSVPSYTDDQAQQIATVVTTPVDLTATARHGSTVSAGLAPAVLAVTLWLGTLMMFLTRGAVPSGAVWAQATAARRVLWGWIPAVLVGAMQAALLIGLMLVAGVGVRSPVGVSLFCGLGVLAFAATNQALVSAFGGIGRLVSLGFGVAEAAALGGLVPIQTAPALLQALNQVLPLPQFVNGAGTLVLGGGSGLLGACVALALWTAAALIVSIITTARRHPRLAPGLLPDPPGEASATPAAPASAAAAA